MPFALVTFKFLFLPYFFMCKVVSIRAFLVEVLGGLNEMRRVKC